MLNIYSIKSNMPKIYTKKYKKLKNQYLIKFLIIKAGNDNPILKDELKKIMNSLIKQFENTTLVH